MVEMNDITLPTEKVGVTVQCAVHGKYGNPVFACVHCLKQDAERPDGIVKFVPRFFGIPPNFDAYLCKTCFGNVRPTSFKLLKMLTLTCQKCLQAEIRRITKLDPAKFFDASGAAELGRR